MLLHDLVATSAAVAATRSRLTKTALIAEALSAAEGEEVEIVAAFLGGRPRQRRTGLGWRSLASLPAPATTPGLTVTEVDSTLERLAALEGVGSQAARAAEVEALFARATAGEQEFLRALILENLRQGASDSLLLDAVARAAGVPAAAVRRAAMFSADSGPVAAAALAGGLPALESFGLVPGRAVRPMLASSAPDLAAALERFDGPVAVDRKLDGIRIQVHRDGDQVRVFTRGLEEVGHRLPEVVAFAHALPVRRVVLDGEAIALREDGSPRPFQETAARAASASMPATRVPLTGLFFDLLHLDGDDLLDRPTVERLRLLDDLVPPEHRVPRVITADLDEATRFEHATLAAGHEGVVVKGLDAPYEAGRRGAAWVKVKPRRTADLVVLAVEWGSGRRRGLLSNIHLGARDGDGWAMVGKTFKGMTDEMLAWQTERFLELETHREGHVVHVAPAQVVEIAFDGVQRSSRYASGVALRFARVLRYRDDKPVAETDTIETLRAAF